MKLRLGQSERFDRSILESSGVVLGFRKGALCDFQRPEPASRSRSCPEARNPRSSRRVAQVVRVTQKARSGWRREDARNLTPNPFPRAGRGTGMENRVARFGEMTNQARVARRQEHGRALALLGLLGCKSGLHTSWMLVASTITRRDVPWGDHMRMDADSRRCRTELRSRVRAQYRLDCQRGT
jgi:hypothetical protein